MKKSMLSLGFFVSLGCRTQSYTGPQSAHFDGKRFHNENAVEPKGFLDLLRWQLNGEEKTWPETVPLTVQPQLPTQLHAGEVAVSFVNHATLLIQVPGFNILSDPVWSERVSPFSSIGPKRVHKPGIRFEDLPPIQVVIVSHNHYDHLDLPTLKRLAAVHHPRIIVPLGDRSWLEAEGVTGVEELDWWQAIDLDAKTKIHFTPSQHWSARGPFDRNLSLWGAYFIEVDQHGLYFAGDTGYGPHFKELQRRLPPIRLALLPIGAYEPRWFMGDQHLNPADAVQAHLDLKATRSLGIHYGCWQLTDEGRDEPRLDLERARKDAQLQAESFEAAEPGRTYRLVL